MEAHRVHISLPAKAKVEAMDVLMWARTGNNYFYLPTCAPLLKLSLFSSIERLLPSHRTFPAPFTWEVCQELKTLTRCFGGSTQTSLFF